MRKPLTAIAIVLCSLLLFGGLSAATGENDKVTICHRTNSNSNPYVQITVDSHAVDGEKGKGPDHYGRHQGPVWNPSLKAQKIKWGDIIPPVDPYHDGLNWTEEGIAIYENGCVVPTTPTTVPEPPTTTTTVSGRELPPPVIVRNYVAPKAPPAPPVEVAPAFTG